MTELSEFANSSELWPTPTGRWSVLGIEPEVFEQKLLAAGLAPSSLRPYHADELPYLDGLLLAGALSTAADPVALLRTLTPSLKPSATLAIIDWQADGPPTYGPNFEVRFKRGLLCRLLRAAGFGQVDTMDYHPVYYEVFAVKGPPRPLPHAAEFVEVAQLSDLPGNSMKKVEVYGHQIVVANTGREIVAFAHACPHAEGPLELGRLRRQLIACPLHGYIWNVSTGNPVMPDDEDCLRRYSVKVDDVRDTIMVSLAPPPESIVAD
ncbi:MAG: Rieske 2Fe-2S domain-containing protein [Anaerolineales bacterium]|nr:Rieske 2Fe-2S domain-containing protein [Anaerolineales bacterium]